MKIFEGRGHNRHIYKKGLPQQEAAEYVYSQDIQLTATVINGANIKVADIFV
jgi:hypothetical protein